MLIAIFIFQALCCLLAAILYAFFRYNNESSMYYVDWKDNSIFFDSVLIFFSYYVLLSTFIPISLIVSIEIIKVFQAYFINNDKLMYSSFRKQGVTCKAVSLNEELGQI